MKSDLEKSKTLQLYIETAKIFLSLEWNTALQIADEIGLKMEPPVLLKNTYELQKMIFTYALSSPTKFNHFQRAIDVFLAKEIGNNIYEKKYWT